MNCNVGGTDRAFRGIVALAGLGTAACPKLDSRLRLAAGILGALASFAFTTQYCPLNQALGINTCNTEARFSRNVLGRAKRAAATLAH
jgi:hypothetical protein